MEVPTRVGPLRVTDIMEIYEWIEGKRMGVRHVGRIGGWGRFELSGSHPASRITWVEQLRFPWYLGGALVKWLSRPVLHRIFRANLTRFQRWVEANWAPES